MERLLPWLVGLTALVVVVVIVNLVVHFRGARWITTTSKLPAESVALVLGARVYPDGRVSHILADRLHTAWTLYSAGQVTRIILSGDHRPSAFDEVTAMRTYLQAQGVREQDLIVDHVGFDTWSSVRRARHVFQLSEVVIVTQTFHLPRALFMARAVGLAALGVSADLRVYQRRRISQLREIPARLKALTMVLMGKRLHPAEQPVPLPGDGRVTWTRGP